jgi:hypothetical protein
LENAEPLTISPGHGIRINGREELENASNSIFHNNEPDSTKTDERDPEPQKQPELIISTVRGMKMDAREEFENASDGIAWTKRSASIPKITRRRWTGP